MFSTVKYGDPNLVPSFWLNEDWDWSKLTKNLSNVSNSEYTGPGNFNDFISRVISTCLSNVGINPKEYVTKNIDNKTTKLSRVRQFPVWLGLLG